MQRTPSQGPLVTYFFLILYTLTLVFMLSTLISVNFLRKWKKENFFDSQELLKLVIISKSSLPLHLIHG